MTGTATSVDQIAIDTIRTLAIDGVQQANSGHPGAPMGAAPMAYVLWTRFLRHAPTRPDWFDRDRFVLSAGHASMLLYSLLHLTGYDLPLDELKRFRQLGSRTPGHPEYGLTAGVEATTGPLGQGFANAIGMAIAERRLAAEFAHPSASVIDHWTYGICSDGDLQEGIASEAASLAGHLRLGKLVFLYDDNHIQLDGPTSWAWSEDVLARFDAYRWHTQRVEDGNDLDAITTAIAAARGRRAAEPHRGANAHRLRLPEQAGQPEGARRAPRTRRGAPHEGGVRLGSRPDVPHPARGARALPTRGRRGRAPRRRLGGARGLRMRPRSRSERRSCGAGSPGAFPRAGTRSCRSTRAGDEALATRNASKNALQVLKVSLPELIGGAADLSESNLTDLAGEGDFSATESGRNLRFGVREHAMGGIGNGIAYHGGLRPYVATFLTFSDYMRGSVRLAALSGLPITYVWTHDSVGLGEDGPTHQPVEHYAALRAMPGLRFVRAGDANEASAAWALAIEERDGPTALAFTRQKLPILPGTAELARDGVRAGAYVLADATDADGKAAVPDLILIATGSELHLAVAARTILTGEGIRTRVVSMPCWERFEAQPEAYRDAVLPPTTTRRVSIEAGVSLGWDRWVGPEGAMMAIDRFGLSAPAERIFEHFGFTAEHVAEVARGVLVGERRGVISPPAGHGA